MVHGSMELQRSEFNYLFLNFKAKSMNKLDAGNGDSSSTIRYYTNYSVLLHLQYSSAKKKSHEAIKYSSQLFLIVTTPGKGSLLLGTNTAPRMTKES